MGAILKFLIIVGLIWDFTGHFFFFFFFPPQVTSDGTVKHVLCCLLLHLHLYLPG